MPHVNEMKTHQPPCPGCGRQAHRIGFVPVAECKDCREDIYRCESCERRWRSSVCSLPDGPPKGEIGRFMAMRTVGTWLAILPLGIV
jgi:hypothetical protein